MIFFILAFIVAIVGFVMTYQYYRNNKVPTGYGIDEDEFVQFNRIAIPMIFGIVALLFAVVGLLIVW